GRLEAAEADVTQGHVVEDDGEILRSVQFYEGASRSFVVFQGLGKAIQPVQDIAYVAVQPPDAQPVIVFFEDLACAACQSKCPLISTQIDEWLQHAICSPCNLQVKFQLLKCFKCGLVFLCCGVIVAGQIHHVARCA